MLKTAVFLWFFFFSPFGLLYSQASGGQDEIEALRVWWQTSTTSPRVGEIFYLTLTVEAANTAEDSVVIENSLEPETMSLLPLEIIDSLSSVSNLLRGHSRFTQYRYALRIVSEEFFGRELKIPELEVRYRVAHSTGRKRFVLGAQASKKLEAIPIKIQSVVEQNAKNIRDGTNITFSDVGSRKFAGNILFGFAGLFLFLAFVLVFIGFNSFFTKKNEGKDVRYRVLSERHILEGLSRELIFIKNRRSAGNWSDELLERSASAIRILCAIVMERDSASIEVKNIAVSEGQIKVVKGFWPKRVFLVSSPVTAESVSQHQGVAQEIKEALEIFTLARYGGLNDVRESELDGSFDKISNSLKTLKQKYSWSRVSYGKFQNWLIAWRKKWIKS